MLAETSTDLICVLEPDGAVRYASPACRELLGLEPEALLGRAFTDLVARGRRRGRRRGARRAREEAPVSITHRLRRAEGSVWVETRLRVVRDPATRDVSRATRRSATSPSACTPRPRWPRPRSASAPPSRRRRSAWR